MFHAERHGSLKFFSPVLLFDCCCYYSLLSFTQVCSFSLGASINNRLYCCCVHNFVLNSSAPNTWSSIVAMFLSSSLHSFTLLGYTIAFLRGERLMLCILLVRPLTFLTSCLHSLLSPNSLCNTQLRTKYRLPPIADCTNEFMQRSCSPLPKVYINNWRRHAYSWLVQRSTMVKLTEIGDAADCR